MCSEDSLRSLLTDIASITPEKKDELNFSGYERINGDELLKNLRNVALNSNLDLVIIEFKESFGLIYKNLLIYSLLNWKVNESDGSSPRSNSRISLRLLVNLTQRCQEFASAIPHDVVDVFTALLFVHKFDNEILMLLTKTAGYSYTEFQKSPRYCELISAVIETMNDNEDNISSALAYISIILEKDYALLANCYAEMTSKQFSELLEAVSTLIEHTDSKIHHNNITFIFNLLELICFDYQSFCEAKQKVHPLSPEERKKGTVCLTKYLTQIVGIISSKKDMIPLLFDQTVLINCLVDLIDCILNAEADLARKIEDSEWIIPSISEAEEYKNLRNCVQQEERIRNARKKQGESRNVPLPGRIERVELSENLKLLSSSILLRYMDLNRPDYGDIGELKLYCLQSIAHLCNISSEFKLMCTSNGRNAIVSILQCTTRKPLWFLETATIPDQPIMDRNKLLKEFGLEEFIEDNENKLDIIPEE